MARTPKHIRELTKQIEALPPRDQAQLLEQVLTPQMRLRLLANQLRGQVRARSDGQLDRAVNRAVKRVRQAAR